MFIVVTIFIILFLILLFMKNKEMFNPLKEDWNKIFPDGNRNAAGAKFFKYILDKNVDYNKFMELNKLYCSVSGSLVEPDSKPYFIKLNDLDNNIFCGDYYACCWPCVCDIMKYAKVIETTLTFKDGENSVYLIVIDNPCGKDFPSEVNKKYFCKDNKLDKTQIYSLSNKLVIGVLHNAKMCSDADINRIENNDITNSKCGRRNSMNVDNLTYGMGDIFIKMAS